MKFLRLFLLICYCLTSLKSHGQNPKAIEADLLKSFKKINYWDERIRDTTINAGDSLDNANNAFGEKLKLYAEKYPLTINYPFNYLKKQYLNICSSADGLFRIYSWDTGGGGTMREFENVMQYKTGNKAKSELVVNSEDLGIPFYSNLYTFKMGNKTYYLGIFGFIESSRYAGAGIKLFAIENNKLNRDVKLLKTRSGLKNEISYEYDFGSIAYIPFEKRPAITFDAATQTIRIPVVTGKGIVTKKLITYKFTGQYFEIVKN
ncbi:MAG TPA: hypothetical protein VK668_07205 [Mucilaginibacter sp.]|nr:hypothetical protein [Mucilaginibacter sp.]